jgi:hypothetical protein
LRHLFEAAQRRDTVTESLLTQVQRLSQPHRRFPDSSTWALTPDGLSIDAAAPEISPGEPATVTRIWNEFGLSIRRWSNDLGVPPELIIATICTESGGDPGRGGRNRALLQIRLHRTVCRWG